MELKIRVLIQSFKEKPDNGKVTNLFKTSSDSKNLPLSPEQLATIISKGCCFFAGCFKEEGSTKKDNLKDFCLVALDIDNPKGLSIKEIVDSIHEKFDILPLIVYHTFSSTPEKPRYRLIYTLEEIIPDIETYERLLKHFIQTFDFLDPACTNANRFYVGTHMDNKRLVRLFKNSKPISKNFVERLPTVKEMIVEKKSALTQLNEARYSKIFKADMKHKAKEGNRHNHLLKTLANIAQTHADFLKQDGKENFINNVLKFYHHWQENPLEVAEVEQCAKDSWEKYLENYTSQKLEASEHFTTLLKEYPCLIARKTKEDLIYKVEVDCKKILDYLYEADVRFVDGQFKSYINGYYAICNLENMIIQLKLIPERDIEGHLIKKLKEDLQVQPRFVVNTTMDCEYLNFKNGLFHKTKGCLIEHSKEIFTPFQIPYNFNANAESNQYLKAYLDNVFSTEAEKQRFFEMLGYILMSPPAKKFFHIFGVQNSGKTTLSKILGKLFGVHATYIPAHELEKSDSYRIPELAGSIVNIADECDGTFKNVNRIKELSGGHPIISGSRKYENNIDFKYFGTMIFISNSGTQIHNSEKAALIDRLVVIKMDKTVSPEQKIMNIEDWLPYEYIIAESLRAYARLKANNFVFTEVESCKVENVLKDCISDFIADCFIPCSGAVIPKDFINELYDTWAKSYGDYALDNRQRRVATLVGKHLGLVDKPSKIPHTRLTQRSLHGITLSQQAIEIIEVNRTDKYCVLYDSDLYTLFEKYKTMFLK